MRRPCQSRRPLRITPYALRIGNAFGCPCVFRLRFARRLCIFYVDIENRFPTPSKVSASSRERGASNALFRSGSLLRVTYCREITFQHAGNVSKTVSMEVRVERPTDHVIAYTTAFTQHGSSGTLTHGANSGPALFDALPTVDMGFYQGIADVIYSGNQTFQTPSVIPVLRSRRRQTDDAGRFLPQLSGLPGRCV